MQPLERDAYFEDIVLVEDASNEEAIDIGTGVTMDPIDIISPLNGSS